MTALSCLVSFWFPLKRGGLSLGKHHVAIAARFVRKGPSSSRGKWLVGAGEFAQLHAKKLAEEESRKKSFLKAAQKQLRSWQRTRKEER